MTLQQLTYFLAAAQHGSFTAAADVLRSPARASPSRSPASRPSSASPVRARRPPPGAHGRRPPAPPEAERTLAAAAEASDAVRRARTLAGGTASLGTFSTAEHLLLPGLVEDFAQRHPEVAVRMVGQNSSELADAVRAGRLEAGLVALPIDADGLEVGPAVAQFEVVYASARPGGLDGAVTVEQLAAAVLVLPEARWGDEDPTRRQLAERAQRAGIAIRPRIEVQHAHAALELAARGLGDTLVTRALLEGLGYAGRLASVPLDPPLHEAFAFISRRNARLSPATRALMALAEHHLARRSGS